MLRLYLRDRVPVIQINERSRFLGFRDAGRDMIAGHAGLYVAREPDDASIRGLDRGVLTPLGQVQRTWRGRVMDIYDLEKLTGWTPELSRPPELAILQMATTGRGRGGLPSRVYFNGSESTLATSL